MISNSTLYFSLLILGASATALIAGEPAAHKDKSMFHLFNPTPKELMREMSTDRPDLTESPFTVDAGHVQVEMDLVNFNYDRRRSDDADVRAESWVYGAVNMKFGLLPNTDLQVIAPLYERSRERDRTTRSISHGAGFGDVTVRLKQNLWGNDGGKTAFGIMPFITLPTDSEREVEGGVILPFSSELPRGWTLGAMLEFDARADSDAQGHHLEAIGSITVSHTIVGNLGGYLEWFNNVSAESGAKWVSSFDCGLTYGIGDNIQLDAGVNVGLTAAADDLNPFVGISWRF